MRLTLEKSSFLPTKVATISETSKLIGDALIYTDAITFEATKAYIRIKSKDKQKIKENIFKLLAVGDRSVRDGTVAILADEELDLDKKEMLSLIKTIDNEQPFNDDLDYICRDYLISAMAT